MTFKIVRTIFGILSLAATIALPALADIDIDGTFQPGTSSEFQTLFVGSTAITDGTATWTVTSGTTDAGNSNASVDLIGSYWPPPLETPNTYSIDLDGNYPGGITQNVSLTAGSYVLTFYLSGNPDGGPPVKGLKVLTGTTTNNFTYDTAAMGNSEANMKYTKETVDFTTAGGPTTIAFTSTDPNAGALIQSCPAFSTYNCPYGPVVGGVSLVSTPHGGTTLALLGLAVAGLAGFRRKLSI